MGKKLGNSFLTTKVRSNRPVRLAVSTDLQGDVSEAGTRTRPPEGVLLGSGIVRPVVAIRDGDLLV